MGQTPTVALRRMRADEFAAFRERFIEAWAADLARVEDLSPESARQEAARRTDADLPQAEATPNHHLYVITADGRAVGTLWFSLRDRRAFVDDITIVEADRDNGYGRRALELMERELSGLDATSVRLNVYQHNPRAHALYQALGYQTTGITMRKAIAPPVRLVAATIDQLDAELAGDHAELARLIDVEPIQEWPPVGGQHDAGAVGFFRQQLLADPAAADWLAFYVLAGRTLVGSAGFLGPPHDGVAEIGFSICQRHRGRGLGRSAVRALTNRADDAGVQRLIARTGTANVAAIRVLERNGFAVDGTSHGDQFRLVRSRAEPLTGPSGHPLRH